MALVAMRSQKRRIAIAEPDAYLPVSCRLFFEVFA